GGCNLAIESTMIFHTPKVKEMIELLGIPVIVDRSSCETHPLARTEWIKLYAALIDKEDEAEEFFDERAEVIDAYKDYPNTEKTVAFFYISSDGSVVVRASTDYVPKMIEIAGGRYALKDIVDPDSTRSSVSTTMELFYDAAVDADYLIYNSSIDAPLNSLNDLMNKSELFSDFKAVQQGNVWCTGKDMYQATDDVGELIIDIHNMLTGDEEDMRFLYKVE
ncbi:MAG: ABC transporter substrate-binding protein, partial [Clostridia bacterium]|nr:ABC transporter substrate-binding protein [Clostridia bacterium]